MKKKINTIIIAKDGWPLEQFIGNSLRTKFTNFLRRLLLTDHIECRDCYERKSMAERVDNAVSQQIQPKATTGN